MSIKALLEQRVRTAMNAADIPDNCPVNITISTRPEFGDFQANGAMGAAKRLKTNPRELAQKILENIDKVSDLLLQIDIIALFANIH